jgi:hypothetical protein
VVKLREELPIDLGQALVAQRHGVPKSFRPYTVASSTMRGIRVYRNRSCCKCVRGATPSGRGDSDSSVKGPSGAECRSRSLELSICQLGGVAALNVVVR